MYQVYLGLGSNLGDRLENLTRAIQRIGTIATVHALSSVYETEPIDMDDLNKFYNMAVSISTPHDPPLLLVQLKAIENKMGRKNRSRNEPRMIDIDILLYRGLAYEDNTVSVPHPALVHRRFALEPLCEISPLIVHPILEKTVAFLLRNCRDKHNVTRTELLPNLQLSN